MGFSNFDSRSALHSLLGCAFYGAFATKMLSFVRRSCQAGSCR
ncbi:DUF6529 family protein [Kribbella sp. CA-294648]